MEDKRRIPYNIWVIVLGVVIFLLISGIGVSIFYSSLKADVNVDGKIKYLDWWYAGGDFKEYVEYLTPVCKEETNCSTENVEVKFVYNSCSWTSCEEVHQPITDNEPSVNLDKSKNWQLIIIKWISYIIGVLVFFSGIMASTEYIKNHYWKKGDYCKPDKKK